ncbi:5-formyltetrahydrofolate cyclo-ligase [Marivirga lumbricoides]|uniref:5-formyltetrahydrofolate cyclo-ligase n=1 Tax=Marivirga lumbricoides TaxID=1046115 RepID=A0ABQ1MM84_9BACT|nr:5-formyltetrahydrofolate cyclo-ligase [Marivirga lumbricoides]
MDKQTLRKVYLGKRKTLSTLEYQRRNQLLTTQLISFVRNKHFKNIHIFLPITSQKEPDTFPFIYHLWENHPEINVITSISDLKTPEMQHYRIDKQIVIQPNKWGIPEPRNASLFPIERIDCVLVPMIVGSKTGHRIGYGKGYYDRFLQKCSSSTFFLGISLSPLLEGNIYADKHDQKMNATVTPFQMHPFNKEY